VKKILSIVCACASACAWHVNVTAIAKETRDRKDTEHRVHSKSNPGVQCVVENKRRTTRDAVNYPGAYEEGYIQGTKARASAASFQSPTKDGELARGYADGYERRAYAGQLTIVPTVNDVSCGCRTRILKGVLFRSAIEVSCTSERSEFESTAWSDAYHPQAYNDGYREGIASKAKRETYQVRAAGGEFARGFEDGYFGRANSGQRYTVMPVKDYRCQCQLDLVTEREN
jgi:hypothetical protein